MISRIRAEAFGPTAADVEDSFLALFATLSKNPNLGQPITAGETVIQRNLAEPDGRSAFSGRTLIYANVAEKSGEQ